MTTSLEKTDNEIVKIVNQRGFSSILIISVFVVLLASIPLGAFYLKGQVQNKSQEALTNTEKPSEEPNATPKISENKPENTITAFFQAVKDKNKSKAKSYLSGNVNKAAFKSTFEDDTNSPSLYNQDFTYKITQSKIDSDGNKAFVNVDIAVSGQTLPTLVTLEKNTSGMWLINDSETAVYDNTNMPFDQQSRQSTSLNRTLLLLSGPAEFYITSPEGTHTGFDPNLKKQVNEIKDVSYRIGAEQKSLAITDLIGTWELKVVGAGNGKYSIGTQLVNPQDPQTAVIEGTATSGSVDTYIIRYPSQTGKPLEVTITK